MKKDTAEVKASPGKGSDGKALPRQVVGTAHFEIYESASEACDHIGETKVLELLNAQVKTNAMNVIRAEKTGEPSVKSLRGQAFSELMLENKIQQHAGNIDEINRLVDERVRKLQDDAKKARLANPSAASETNGDEEGEEEEEE